MAQIEDSGGGDAGRAVVGVLEDQKKELTKELINYWYEQSQLHLEEAASNRATIASEGRAGRESTGLYAIHQQSVPPVWTNEHWEFAYPHEGAIFQEEGARPHEIRARKAEVLAFEWPDAPQEVKEQFEDTEGDLVFFESIDHPGIPAIGFVRRGRDKTEEKAKELGYRTESYTDSST